MNYERAIEVWSQIGDTAEGDFLDDLVDSAIRYARIRVDVQRANSERKRSLDGERTLIHNGLISHCDILARMMKRRGEDASWRERLGTDRKVIGDFACWLHAHLGIQAR